MFREHDTFLLKRPIADTTVAVGSRGTVLICHDASPAAYEVEFCDAQGQTLALTTLTEDYMAPEGAGTSPAGERFYHGRWLYRDRIYSKEGFSVQFGRDSLIYREGKGKMVTTVDSSGNDVTLFITSIGRWNADLMNSVDDAEKQRIATNIQRALESQGYSVHLFDDGQGQRL